MILIPLPLDASRGDQILNAENFNKNGFANVILQENLNTKTLLDTIESTLRNSNTFISKMKTHKNANGNTKIIELIENIQK